MKKILLLATIAILFTGCSNTLLITQGEQGYAGDLNEGYEVVELDEISATNRSFFGFVIDKNKKDGVITNFNSYNRTVSNLPRFFTYLTWSAVLPVVTSFHPIGVIGGIFLGGAINNSIWSRTSYNVAQKEANLRLISENPEIDLFVYPKYKVETKVGLFTNKSNITIYTKGAKLKTK